MAFFGKKRQKKKATRGMFERIEVDGKTLPILNFYLYTDKNAGKRYIELSAAEEVPEIHFSEIEADVILTEKKLHLSCIFADAFQNGKFNVYKFEVVNLKEYFH
ncbi:MAG: hypothetical protein LUG85_01265 [Clostridiales bacterium]|nr:hypothetical protein [Clostridiales bacterium]